MLMNLLAIAGTKQVSGLMCLGIPMQIKSITGYMENCEAKGVERDVSLFMMQDDELLVDDSVVVHVGYAIQKITPQEARTALDLYGKMLTGENNA